MSDMSEEARSIHQELALLDARMAHLEKLPLPWQPPPNMFEQIKILSGLNREAAAIQNFVKSGGVLGPAEHKKLLDILRGMRDCKRTLVKAMENATDVELN